MDRVLARSGVSVTTSAINSDLLDEDEWSAQQRGERPPDPDGVRSSRRKGAKKMCALFCPEMACLLAVLVLVCYLGVEVSDNGWVDPFRKPQQPVCASTRRKSKRLAAAAETSFGPRNGTLFVMGGLEEPSSGIYARFLSEAGNASARIVYIPTNDPAACNYSAAANATDFAYLLALTGWPAAQVRWLHTYDRNVADSEAFVAPLADATAVFFGGGRSFLSVDAYAGTRTERAIAAVLGRHGVVGGSSAGSAPLGSFMARGDATHPAPLGNNWQMEAAGHMAGFSFAARCVAFDEHSLYRNREWDLIQVLEQRPHLLGIGIDQNAAIILKGDEFEVVGMPGYVAVYDTTLWAEPGLPKADGPRPVPSCPNWYLTCGDGRPRLAMGGRFFLLRNRCTEYDAAGLKCAATRGDRYNIRTRRVVYSAECSGRGVNGGFEGGEGGKAVEAGSAAGRRRKFARWREAQQQREPKQIE